MDLKLYNTLTGNKEAFRPVNTAQAGMYHCGPTVYNYAHIGNLRSYVFADVVRRTFELAGYSVSQVINITDVGHLTSDADTGKDKMEEGARREGKTAAEIAEFYTKAFISDLKSLNVRTERTVFPKATEHIPEQIELISRLEEKGFAYKTSDGIYFDTAKFSEYGKLGQVNVAGLKEGARVEINSEKRSPTDFALWKFSQPHEKRQQEWESPWGVGFPGWHVECSAMSMKYLGETFDIHTGGIDHIPVHHNNEIAQSESATGKPFANYWMHNAFLNINDSKISKSVGNTVYLSDVAERGHDPLSYRYLLMTTHYRSPLNFTWKSLEGAGTALEKLRRWYERSEGGGTPSDEHIDAFKAALADDFDTPAALAILWKVVRSRSIDEATKKATVAEFDKVFGFELGMKKESAEIPAEVIELVKKRETARADKDFKLSDELRLKIAELGYAVKDTGAGTEIERL